MYSVPPTRNRPVTSRQPMSMDQKIPAPSELTAWLEINKELPHHSPTQPRITVLYTRVGLGQSAALVRYRGDPGLRGAVVRKFLVDFQPGRQLAGGGDFLVHRHWLAACDRTISGRRNGVHVGYTRTALGAAPF